MIKQMKTFIQLVDEGNFEKAAEKRMITPEEARRQIKLLESVVGVPLIEQDDEKIELTDAGKSFFRDVHEIVYETDDAMLRARETRQHDPYVIRVGASLLNPCKDLLQSWKEIENQYPQFKIQVVTFEDGEDAFDEAHQVLGKCDLFVGTYDSVRWKEQFGLLKLGEYKFTYTLAKNHPLAKRKQISLSDLQGERLIIEKKGISGAMDTARYFITTQNPEIEIEDTPHQYDMEVFDRCAKGNEIILTLEVWDKIHKSLVMIPGDLTFTVPFGLLYPLNPPAHVAQFVRSLEGKTGRIWE